MRTKRILLCLAHMSEAGEEQKFIKEAFDSNWVAPLGPNVNKFEEGIHSFVTGDSNGITIPELADRQVVALSSGTAAVHMALIGCGVQPGDEVMVQSFTFCASCNPVKYLGATPVFVDSESDTWNIDPDLLEKAIIDRKEKTGNYPKAIIPTSLYGMPYNCERIIAISEKYGIPVIEDAAEGLGSRFKGQVLGTFGKYGVLSFNGNKIITTSGGGALICPDKESKEKIMWYATQARDAYPYYQHTAIGYNYRMSNICAGIGRGQLTILNEHIAHHRHVAQMYKEAFAEVEGIEFHDEIPGMESNFWLSTILLDEKLKVRGEGDAYKSIVNKAVGGAAGQLRDTGYATTDCQPNTNVEAMRIALDKENIETRPLWKPMHKQPVYKDAPAYINGVAESIFKRGMCLPSGPIVTDEDVRYIIESIKKNIIR